MILQHSESVEGEADKAVMLAEYASRLQEMINDIR